MDFDSLISLLAKIDADGRAPALGIVGGTFNPVHQGHLALGRALLECAQLDAVLYIPAGIPAFKQDKAIASGMDRLCMTELALDGAPRMAVSDMEIRRSGITYTVDTMRELRQHCPASTRYMMAAGADVIPTLYAWHEADELSRLVEFIAFERPGYDLNQGIHELRSHMDTFRVRSLAYRMPNISSSEIRQRVAQGLSIEGLVPPSVACFIEQTGLYASTPDQNL